jgi:hypothetical protein
MKNVVCDDRILNTSFLTLQPFWQHHFLSENRNHLQQGFPTFDTITLRSLDATYLLLKVLYT